MGHMLRHKPVATTSNKGAIGIKMFQNKWIPNSGRKIRHNKIHNPIRKKMSCTVLQYRIDFAESVVPGFNDLLIIFFI